MEMFLLMSSIILLGYLVYLFYLTDGMNRKLDNIMKQLKVVYKGKKYILKEMKESMNYGLDYILVDKCKELFGLQYMNMRRIKSDEGQIKIDCL